MKPSGPDNQSYENRQAIETTIRSLNDRMENEASTAANRAFNLGCFVGLVPVALVVLLTYFVADHSWLGAALISVLLLLGLILFANVIASISRQNTLKRIYREEVALEIDRALLAHQINRSSFEQLGYKILPQRAVLLAFFEPLEEVLTDDPRSYAENYPDDYDGDKNPEMKKQG